MIRDYVQAHLRKRISLDNLAAAVSLSRFHFCHRFHQATGTSPHELVLQQRVARARSMLSRTDAALSLPGSTGTSSSPSTVQELVAEAGIATR